MVLVVVLHFGAVILLPCATGERGEQALPRKKTQQREREGGGSRSKKSSPKGEERENKAAAAADAKTVREALQEEVLDTKGESVRYTRSDIHYDVQAERLELRAGSTGSSSSN